MSSASPFASSAATIRSLAGLAPDPAAEGEPLIGIDGRIAAARTGFGAAYAYGQRTYRDERYKLIVYHAVPEANPGTAPSAGTATVQLFDLRDDPWEMVNLADDPEHAAIRDRLEAGLRDWQREVGDPMVA